jgi:hypothetical protein
MKAKLSALDLLFPKVRAEILRILLSEPRKQRYVRELMLMSGLALRTVQEELATLTVLGMVTSWSNGIIASIGLIATIRSSRLSSQSCARAHVYRNQRHRRITGSVAEKVTWIVEES